MPDIRVLIVDDHAILRDGLRSLLDRQNGITVVGEAGNGQEALERIGELQPAIVLMDVAMPVMDGLKATRLIKETHPEIRVLILTQHDNPEYVQPLLEAGASGYVLKRAGGREVITAIRQIHEQGVFLQGDVARQVLRSYQQTKEPGQLEMPHLTERESEILQLTVEGKSIKEIAGMLVISPKTVSVHRTNIMAKLGVHSGVELVRYVMQHNLVNLGSNKFKT